MNKKGWTQAEVDAEIWGDDVDHDYDGSPPEVKGTDAANYHLRRAVRLQSDIDGLTELYEHEIELIRERLAWRVGILERQMKWHSDPVEAWHRAQLREKAVGKTVHLPAGTLKLRGRQKLTEVQDEDKLRAFMLENGLEDKIWVVKEPVMGKKALKDHIKIVEGKHDEPGSALHAVLAETNKRVPGVLFRVSGDSFSFDGGK